MSNTIHAKQKLFLIAIAGGSTSGKAAFTNLLKYLLEEKIERMVCTVREDWYLIPTEDFKSALILEKQEALKQQYNINHPSAHNINGAANK